MQTMSVNRSRSLLGSTLVLPLLLVCLLAFPVGAQAKTYADLEDGVYLITNEIAGKSLDIKGGKCSSGSNIQVYGSNYTRA